MSPERYDLTTLGRAAANVFDGAKEVGNRRRIVGSSHEPSAVSLPLGRDADYLLALLGGPQTVTQLRALVDGDAGGSEPVAAALARLIHRGLVHKRQTPEPVLNPPIHEPASFEATDAISGCEAPRLEEPSGPGTAE